MWQQRNKEEGVDSHPEVLSPRGPLEAQSSGDRVPGVAKGTWNTGLPQSWMNPLPGPREKVSVTQSWLELGFWSRKKKKKKQREPSFSDGQAGGLGRWALWWEMQQDSFKSWWSLDPRATCVEQCLVFRCGFSLRLGTGERGMAQPVVTQHGSCCLLQSYCSSLFIKGGCSWILRTNFLFCGCRLVLLSGGGVGCWEGGSVGSRQRGLWPEGHCLYLDGPWSSHLLFYWLEPVAGASVSRSEDTSVSSWCGSCSKGLLAKWYSMHSWALALSLPSDL